MDNSPELTPANGCDELRVRALALYKPPFRFDDVGGYVWDSASHMVADQGAIGELAPLFVARVRGWGRIGQQHSPEALQDEVGRIMADALNAFWQSAASSQPPLPTKGNGRATLF